MLELTECLPLTELNAAEMEVVGLLQLLPFVMATPHIQCNSVLMLDVE
jgi:hypothetical protein